MTAPEVQEQLKAIHRSVMRAIADEAPIEWKHKEQWNARLERLPHSCALWQKYKQYDDARNAYDEADAKRRVWLGELQNINRRIADIDPDVVSTEEFTAMYMRGRMLEEVLKAKKDYHAELKMRAERELNTWGQTWDQYKKLLEEISRIQAAHVPSMMGFSSKPEMLRPLQDQLKRWEAARG